MPNYYSTTAAKGIVNLALETLGSPGLQTVLPTQAISATINSGFSSLPTNSTGGHFYVKITNWTASGTITITGTGTPSNSENYSIAGPTLQQTQSAQLASNEYVTTNAYTAIASITTTGLTNALITVYYIYAGKFAIPSILKSTKKPKVYSANEHNSFIERDKKIVLLTNEVTVDELKQDIYGDISLWWPYMMMGAPTSTATIPASPLSIVTSGAITGSSALTIASQPTAPGMKLDVNVTVFTTAGHVTVVGISNGISGITEQIQITATGDFYSSNTYSTITSITPDGVLSCTASVKGIFGWSYTFLSSGQKYSANIEWFDGTGSWCHPFSFFTEGDFDIKVQTEATLSAKGKCQDKLPIGNRTTTPLQGTNRIPSIGQNLNDLPLVGWQSAVYLDPVTGTAGTTSYGDVEELKVSLKTPDEEHFTFTNSQIFSRVYSGKRECTVDTTIFFIDYLQWEQFRQNLKQYLYFSFIGQYIGTDTNPYYKSWTWTLPIRTDGQFDVTSDPSKASVSAKSMWRTEYDSALGGSYKLVVVSTIPPTYQL